MSKNKVHVDELRLLWHYVSDLQLDINRPPVHQEWWSFHLYVWLCMAMRMHVNRNAAQIRAFARWLLQDEYERARFWCCWSVTTTRVATKRCFTALYRCHMVCWIRIVKIKAINDKVAFGLLATNRNCARSCYSVLHCRCDWGRPLCHTKSRSHHLRGWWRLLFYHLARTNKKVWR